jgi:hypothetical protein
MINVKTHLPLLVVTALWCLTPRAGYMSQSFLEYISLENLSQSSDVIAVVSKMTPDIAMEKVPFDSSGRFPPFKMSHFHFKVIEILYDKFGLPNIKTTMDAVDAGEEARYKNEQKTLLEGQPPVSPVYLAYKPSIPYDKISGQFIVFLSYQGEHLSLAAKSAFESIKNKKKVLRLIINMPAFQPLDGSPKPAEKKSVDRGIDSTIRSSMSLLSLTIKLKHTQFAIGDSIPIEIKLENFGKSPAQVPDPKIGTDFQFIMTVRNDPNKAFYFSRERAINERYPLETPAPKTYFPTIELSPGVRQVYNENLAEYMVNPPPAGAYTLVAEYKGERSNEVVIAIVQPR